MIDIYQEITDKYPNMQYRITRKGLIVIQNDFDLLKRMETWKSPYNELWNYQNHLTIRENRINKRIKTQILY